MFLSVIICTYNRAEYIPGLLRSLAEQSYNKSDYEIVFVNNNSDDNTNEICNNFQSENIDINFNCFNELRQGLSHARNRGIMESEGEILIFIDDDALASKNYLKEIALFFEQNLDVDAAGGKILPKYESKRPKWMSVFLEPVMSVINIGNKEKEFPKNKFPVGANMYFRKSVFDKIGLFNVELGRTGSIMLGGEEKDIFNRLKKENRKIYYIPNSWIYHIIPDKRMTKEFIKKQALGIGLSEKIRALNISKKECIKSCFKEIVKWLASILLFIFYSIIFHYLKGIMILKFRYWVSKGFFQKGSVF